MIFSVIHKQFNAVHGHDPGGTGTYLTVRHKMCPIMIILPL